MQKLLVASNGADYFIGGFIDELDAKIPHTQSKEALQIFGSRLSSVVIDSVAAACVGLEWQFGTHAVTQRNGVFVARSATIVIIFPFRKKCAENAVLHMKHWHVLVYRKIKPRARRGLQQRLQLGDV